MKGSLKTPPPIKKDGFGRWMYDAETLWYLLKKMSAEKQVNILTKALNEISERRCSKNYALALAFGCGYEDIGYYFRKTKIRID